MKLTNRYSIRFAFTMFLLLTGVISIAEAQETRFVDNKYKISVVPPPYVVWKPPSVVGNGVLGEGALVEDVLPVT